MADNRTFGKILDSAVAAIAVLRCENPRVHCLTNSVAEPFTANVLLAAGATPAMTSSSNEIAPFVRRSNALLINLGTLNEARCEVIEKAIDQANELNIPFVLDPVKAELSPPRLAFAREILARRPAILRVNDTEFKTLGEGSALDGSICLARTGKTDLVAHLETRIEISNGHPWMDKVTAMGCAQGALMAALLTCADNPVIAALAAILWCDVAAEQAAEDVKGPGSFAVAFLDRVYDISTDTIRERARLS